MYVDDIILCIRANKKTYENLRQILDVYYEITGQKANMSKSKIYFPKHCPLNTRQRIVNALDITQGEFPFKYLGTYIDPTSRPRQIYQACVNNIQKKLQTWQAKMLTQAGKVTFAKSVISSIPIHNLITNGLTQTQLEKLNSHVRRFIWSKEQNKKGFTQ